MEESLGIAGLKIVVTNQYLTIALKNVHVRLT